MAKKVKIELTRNAYVGKGDERKTCAKGTVIESDDQDLVNGLLADGAAVPAPDAKVGVIPFEKPAPTKSKGANG